MTKLKNVCISGASAYSHINHKNKELNQRLKSTILLIFIYLQVIITIL